MPTEMCIRDSACVERVHHDGVLVQLLVLVVDDDNALAVERPADAAGGAETAAVFVKMVADTACGAVAVVGCLLYTSIWRGGTAIVTRGSVGLSAELSTASDGASPDGQTIQKRAGRFVPLLCF